MKKPQEAQKAKAFWKMKAAKDAGEEYYDPAREDNIRGRNKTRLALWEEHLKDPIVALDEALKCVENSCQKVFARVLCGGSVLHDQCWLPPKFVGKGRSGRAFGPARIQWIVFAHSVHGVECAREVWAARRALSLPDTEGTGDGVG